MPNLRLFPVLALLLAACAPETGPELPDTPAMAPLSSARFALAGPSFVYPVNGQSLDVTGAYMFQVNPIAGATGYLWGFFQDGVLVWENLRDGGALSGTAYAIHVNTKAHDKFRARPVDVWVRAYVNNQWTDATVITIHLNPGKARVLQINYFPRWASNTAYLDPVETGWQNTTVSSMRAATQDMVNAAIPVISDATRFRGYSDTTSPRYLEYSVYARFEYFTAMPRGYPLDATAYRPHYRQILDNHGICTYVDTHGVKEVWIYGYHSASIVPDESRMSSRYGDISNAYPKEEALPAQYQLPRCANSYVLYNFTYQPGGASAIGNTVHNRLHQIENVIFYSENRGYPANSSNVVGSVFWDDFSVYGTRASLPGYQASCGNTHSPPNVVGQEYIYNSTAFRSSNCETWHPDNTRTTYISLNCTRWGCTDVGFYKWFMQSMPGAANKITYQGKAMRNWWDAMYDFNRFIDGGRSLYR